MEAVANNGSPFSIGARSQAKGISWGLFLLSGLLCLVWLCLAAQWASSSWEGWFLSTSIFSYPFGSLFLFAPTGSSWGGRIGWEAGGFVYGGLGGLVWVAFPSAALPGWDSIRSIKLVFGLCWRPISFVIGMNGSSNSRNGWPRSGLEVSGFKLWLKASNSSSESKTSTIFSSSSALVVWEEVPSLVLICRGGVTLGMPLGMDGITKVPYGIGPGTKKLGAKKLICCSRGSLALITHLDVRKLVEMGV